MGFDLFLRGNVIKYLWRYENKGGKQDLEKAEWYLKRLIEEDKILLNDERIIAELMAFVSRSNTFKAEEGQTDDLVMSLVFFAWLTRQEYFADLIEQSKFNYEEATKPEDDNILFIPNQKNDEDGEEDRKSVV